MPDIPPKRPLSRGKREGFADTAPKDNTAGRWPAMARSDDKGCNLLRAWVLLLPDTGGIRQDREKEKPRRRRDEASHRLTQDRVFRQPASNSRIRQMREC